MIFYSLQLEELSSKPSSPVPPVTSSLSSMNNSQFSSTPSFTNSLSDLPPIRGFSSDSRNSSFTVEFKEDSHSRFVYKINNTQIMM